MAHTIGHWISSLVIFNTAGITGIRAFDPLLPVTNVMVALFHNAKLRFSGIPAGTHKLAVAYEAAVRLSRTALVQ